MEVNERIVEEYLKTVKEWFYMTDIPFKVPSNYSNIDILAYDPKNNQYYDFEIKYRSAYVLPQKDIMQNSEFQRFVNQFLRHERQDKIEQIIESDKKVTKIFVTTRKCFGKGNNIENSFKAVMKENNFESEVWYFDDIVPELYKKTNEKGRHNTELMQIIRLIKTYEK